MRTVAPQPAPQATAQVHSMTACATSVFNFSHPDSNRRLWNLTRSTAWQSRYGLSLTGHGLGSSFI
jgi:hypothetical protein